MRILDPAAQTALDAGERIAIDLGSGGPGRHGSFGVDFLPLPGVAIQADLNEPLDAFQDNSIGAVHSAHCLEHVREFLPLMRELHRVVTAGGIIQVVVPHFSNTYGYSDPTHVRFFGLYTFNYFVEQDRQPRRKVPCFYSDIRFEIKDIHVSLQKRSLLTRLRHPRLGRRVNASFDAQDRWERELCWRVPGDEITYWLTPVK
jgi:SAM-dependent methyltransferase